MMLLAGVQSTAGTLSWLVYALCKHPEVQTEAQHQVILHKDQVVLYLQHVGVLCLGRGVGWPMRVS